MPNHLSDHFYTYLQRKFNIVIFCLTRIMVSQPVPCGNCSCRSIFLFKLVVSSLTTITVSQLLPCMSCSCPFVFLVLHEGRSPSNRPVRFRCRSVGPPARLRLSVRPSRAVRPSDRPVRLGPSVRLSRAVRPSDRPVRFRALSLRPAVLPSALGRPSVRSRLSDSPTA